MSARRIGGLVGQIDNRWRHSPTRREALLSLAGILAGSPLLRAQLDPRPLRDHRRVPSMDEMMTAFDFEPICFANMQLANYDYMAHGSDSEFTLRRNREAFQWVDLIERPGTSASSVNTATELLGIKMDYPIFVAPSTPQRDLHPDGDAGMYQGASATGTPLTLASGSSVPIQKVATSADGPRWSQFYPIQNLTAARDQIELFQANGAAAIVVTADQQTSRYERDLHDRYLGGSPRARRRGLCGRPGRRGARRLEVPRRSAADVVQLEVPRRHPALHQGSNAPQRYHHSRRRKGLRRARVRRHHRLESWWTREWTMCRQPSKCCRKSSTPSAARSPC